LHDFTAPNGIVNRATPEPSWTSALAIVNAKLNLRLADGRLSLV